MTVAYEIPLSAGQPQAVTVTLGGVQYRLTLRWCPPAACWVLDIHDNAGVPVARGLSAVPGVDLVGQLRHLGFTGELRVQSISDPESAPTFASLGVDTLLFYVTS